MCRLSQQGRSGGWASSSRNTQSVPSSSPIAKSISCPFVQVFVTLAHLPIKTVDRVSESAPRLMSLPGALTLVSLSGGTVAGRRRDTAYGPVFRLPPS